MMEVRPTRDMHKKQETLRGAKGLLLFMHISCTYCLRRSVMD